MGDDDVAPHDGGLPAVHCGEEIDPETAVRRLRALASSEALYAPRSDYIDAVQRDGMSEAWRTKIMAWFGQLGDSFKLKRETLSSATNYLDRLASIASIFLASKIEETRPFRTSDFVTLSDGLFSASDLRLMELELLCTLKWHLNPPTVHASIHNLLVLFGGRADARGMGAAVGLVSDWMVRVHDCHLPYTDRPDAAQLITECGLKLIALDGDGPLGGGADDAAWPDDRSACDGDGDGVDGEVERATSGGAPLVAASASDDEGDEGTDASDMDRTSPNNVMDVDQIEAFAQEAPLRSQALMRAQRSTVRTATSAAWRLEVDRTARRRDRRRPTERAGATSPPSAPFLFVPDDPDAARYRTPL
ncbi:hypothetical protein JL722_10468 [Aureococcus anophagefferens]|nr:hypothetical protein JL722_10468 [Aureococcus anophagefferens]